MVSEKGKFIVFEGIDGSGKDTQLKLLSEKLKALKIPFQTIAFPRHGHPAAFFVDKYLNPTYPYGNPKEVGPFRGSAFYVLDAYDAGFQMKEWLERGFNVIADRYPIGSNIGHQGGKIKNLAERKKYAGWLLRFAYEIFEIPKPDLNIVLLVTPEVARRRIAARKPKLNFSGKEDAHEEDVRHLTEARNSYLWAAKQWPKDYKIVECAKKGRELTPKEVHEKIWKILGPLLT